MSQDPGGLIGALLLAIVIVGYLVYLWRSK